MKVLPLAALGALVLVASGCGVGTGGVAAQGDACHTLADAGASGKVGPNLDAAFGSDRAQGFKESTVRQVVADQIRFPGNYGATGPTMPKNLVTGADVDAVAAYVASVAGRPAAKGAAAPASTQATTTGAAPSGGGNLAAGKKAFTDNGCNACHTLSAAGATGKLRTDRCRLLTSRATRSQDGRS